MCAYFSLNVFLGIETCLVKGITKIRWRFSIWYLILLLGYSVAETKSDWMSTGWQRSNARFFVPWGKTGLFQWWWIASQRKNAGVSLAWKKTSGLGARSLDQAFLCLFFLFAFTLNLEILHWCFFQVLCATVASGVWDYENTPRI